MKIALLAAPLLALAISGCLHAPPNYPGGGGKNLDPTQFANEVCVDLSGQYEGSGEIVDGDPGSLHDEPTCRLDNVFPFANKEQLAGLSAAARQPNGFYALPSHGKVVRTANRKYEVSFDFPTGRSASFKPSFENKEKYVCTGVDGKIVWGGGGVEGRSEFGPNSTDFVSSLYLDAKGNLIFEKGMQVHMSLRLFGMPTGTAQYHSVYRFKRLP